MSIIFYEKKYCEELIENKNIKEISQRNLNFIAKYIRQQGKISDKELQKRLEEYCLRNNKNFNLVTNHYKIKNAINHSKRYSLRSEPIPVSVCKSDLDKIATINNYKYEKIIFVSLVCAKYFKYHLSRNRMSKKIVPSETLYSNQKIKDIMELAGVKLTKKEWNIAKHILCVGGYISPTIYSTEKFALWLEEKNMIDGIVVIDYRNVISYYQMFKGERMITCCECGVMCLRTGRNQKMCKGCAKKQEILRESKRYNEKIKKDSVFLTQ